MFFFYFITFYTDTIFDYFKNRLKAQSSKPAVTGDNEEKVVFNLIEEAGNKGIWMRDIRLRSNLAITQVTKVLKNLEGKKAIKAVKCVNVSDQQNIILVSMIKLADLANFIAPPN